MSETDRKARARARAGWPVKRLSLAEEGTVMATDPQAGLAMMWRLAVDTWALSGRPMPVYTRERMPGRAIRPPGPRR